MSLNWFTKIYEVVKTIPMGKVMTYGQIARIVGAATPRIVGFALHANKSDQVPCHRVVAKDGSLSEGFAFGGREEHRYRLKQEGITFTPDGKVNMKKHCVDYEKPSAYLIEAIKEAEAELLDKKTTSFTNAKSAIKYLESELNK